MDSGFLFRLLCDLIVTIIHHDQDGNEYNNNPNELWEKGTVIRGTRKGENIWIYLDYDGDGEVYIPTDCVVPVKDITQEDWKNIKGD